MTEKDASLMTIKEFSSLTHTPIDTLKHYDRIDILKPAYVGENRYRYYRPEQALQLTRILFGVRSKTYLADIKKLLSENDLDVTMEMYRRIYSNLEERVHELQSLQATIANLSYYFNFYKQHPPETLFTAYFPEHFILRSPKLKITAAMGNETNIANEFFLKGFHQNHWPHFFLGALYDEHDIRNRDFSMPSYFLKIDHPEHYPSEETSYIAGGHYLCCIYRTHTLTLPKAVPLYLDRIKAAKKNITGAVLAMDIVNGLLTSRISDYHTMLFARCEE
jgi:hypothetical protein